MRWKPSFPINEGIQEVRRRLNRLGVDIVHYQREGKTGRYWISSMRPPWRFTAYTTGNQSEGSREIHGDYRDGLNALWDLVREMEG